LVLRQIHKNKSKIGIGYAAVIFKLMCNGVDRLKNVIMVREYKYTNHHYRNGDNKMTDSSEIANLEAERKSNLLRAMSAVELHPVIVNETPNLTTHVKFPISELASYGVAFEPLMAAFRFVTSGGKASSGFYKVTVPSGGELFRFRDGSGFTAGVKTSTGAVGGGQARLNPLIFDPTLLFMAAALSNIDQKLNTIQENQKEMLEFLIQKERSEIRGDLNFLESTLSSYRHNWNSEKFKNSSYIKVLDIKQSAERKIDFFREQIAAKLAKKHFLHDDQVVKKQIEKLQSDLGDYQLSLYLFAFTSYLDVMLLENFDAIYLDSVISKIEEYAFSYRDLYTKAFDEIESTANSSLQSFFLKSIAKANRSVGTTIAKVPVINKSKLHKKLISSGEKVDDLSSRRVEEFMIQLLDKQSSNVRPFIDNLAVINKLYNEANELLFDEKNIYFLAA